MFRTDLITAMKLHDSFQLNPDEYYVLADPWRQEWEKGVQVPVSPGTIPEPVARYSVEECTQIHVPLCWQLMSTLPWLVELYSSVYLERAQFLETKSNLCQLFEWLERSRVRPVLPVC